MGQLFLNILEDPLARALELELGNASTKYGVRSMLTAVTEDSMDHARMEAGDRFPGAHIGAILSFQFYFFFGRRTVSPTRRPSSLAE